LVGESLGDVGKYFAFTGGKSCQLGLAAVGAGPMPGEGVAVVVEQSSRGARRDDWVHLSKLRLAGLVQTRRDGRRILYRLLGGHVRAPLTEGLFHADHQITGEPVHD
jgi:hypothetical protein